MPRYFSNSSYKNGTKHIKNTHKTIEGSLVKFRRKKIIKSHQCDDWIFIFGVGVVVDLPRMDSIFISIALQTQKSEKP